MKFCLKQKIVTNPPPTDKIEKVSGVTEYEALRAEKLFRYEYANQLNTSLLTFAFTVFTAGLIVFTLLVEFGGMFSPNSDKSDVASYKITINGTASESESDYQIEIKNSPDNGANKQKDNTATEEDNISKEDTGEDNTKTGSNNANDQTYIVFVEYFFACFFLLPCFFSRINFRYTVKNSLRIGQLTDYIREKIEFDDGESWESFKRDYRVNYFYKQPSGVGGAKDIPMWINIISCIISVSIGAMGMHSLSIESEMLNGSIYLIGFWLFVRIIVSVVVEVCLQKSAAEKNRMWYFFSFVIAVLVLIVMVILHSNLTKIPIVLCDIAQNVTTILPIILWCELLQVCILITPKYDREINLANSVLEYTRAKLKFSKFKRDMSCTIGCGVIQMKGENELIFKRFLRESSVIEKLNKKKTEKQLIRYCKTLFSQLDKDNKDNNDNNDNKDLDWKKKREMIEAYIKEIYRKEAYKHA